MSFLDKVLGGTVGSVVKELGDVADKFITTSEEKMAARAKFEEILQRRDAEVEQTIRAELDAQKSIIVAELNQGDNYTKRARPTIVYVGLGMAVFNYALAPLVSHVFGSTLPSLAVPVEFWTIWGGVVGVYSWGRSAEKRSRAPGAK